MPSFCRLTVWRGQLALGRRGLRRPYRWFRRVSSPSLLSSAYYFFLAFAFLTLRLTLAFAFLAFARLFFTAMFDPSF
jgi:hypothetical protein